MIPGLAALTALQIVRAAAWTQTDSPAAEPPTTTPAEHTVEDAEPPPASAGGQPSEPQAATPERSASEPAPATSTAPESGPPADTPPAKGWVAPAHAPGKPKAIPSTAAIARDSTYVPTPPGKKRWRERWQRPGSPQRFGVEFKIGPYLPEVDSRYTGTGIGPYTAIFGETDSSGRVTKKPKQSVMPALAFEWQFLYLAGPLAVGTQIGLFVDRANAPFAVPTAGKPLRSKADIVTFGMVPISLLAIYRFELLADFYHVPLVPYFKGGLNYAFWWAKDGRKKLAVDSMGRKGHGGVLGWQINPGLALRLDFLERGAAKKMDQSSGVNHVSLFGEFQLTRMRNFGRRTAPDLGDKTFFVGLLLEI